MHWSAPMKFFPMAGILSLLAVMIVVTNTRSEDVTQLENWPTIQPAQIKTFVTSENSKVVLDIYSKDNPSEKLYTLRCNKGDADDKIVGEDDYYGMFQCHFLPIKTSGPELLIGEDDWNFNKSYNTRGVFKYEQLIGPCKNDPEFGFRREFNMRGMKLELAISNFSSPQMADMLIKKIMPHFSFDFEVKIIPNESAKSKYTSPSAKKYCGGYYEINSNGEAVYHESSN
jgi:hypothetical protein